MVPRLRRYYGELRLPTALPSRLVLAAWYAVVPGRSLPAGYGHPVLRAWVAFYPGAHPALCCCEATGSPRFLGKPPCAYALPSTPEGPGAPRHLGAQVLPPPPCKTTAPTTCFFRGSVTQPPHSLSTLRHAHCWPRRKTRFRLVASLYRAGVAPAGSPIEGFSLCVLYISILLLLALPGARKGKRPCCQQIRLPTSSDAPTTRASATGSTIRPSRQARSR